MEIVKNITSHPYILLGGVASVLVIMYVRRSGSASSGGTTVIASGTATDPNADALQAAQIAASARVSLASIAAQTTQSNNSVSLAAISAEQNVQTAGIGASMFATASAGLGQNYAMQLAAQNSMTGVTGHSVTSAQLNPKAGAGQYVEQWNSNWQPWMAGAIGQQVPIVSGTGSTAGDVAVINTANTQLEQLFNNVLRAGAGAAPLETQILTTPGQGATITGTATIDPVLVNMTNAGVQSITDITPGTGGTYGFSGSYNPVGATAQVYH